MILKNYIRQVINLPFVMKNIIKLLILLLFFSNNNLFAKDITVCVIDGNSKNNPKYYHMPNTATRLVCELSKNSAVQTLATMYNSGWNLIQVVKVDARYTDKDKLAPSPILYFEK